MCGACGFERPVYNSCGDRHCPTCQGKLSRKWLEGQLSELFATPYFHVIFTIPDTLNALVACNEREFYGGLFGASWGALEALCRRDLGGVPGALGTLHTWGQTLWLHPHVHYVVTGGVLSDDMSSWHCSGNEFLVDVFSLSAEFQKRFCRFLARAKLKLGASEGAPATAEELAALLAPERERDWVVFIKPPLADGAQLFEYLSRYTHRVAIGNRRILDVSDSGIVTFQYKDYRAKDDRGLPEVKTMPLPALEFLGRFLRHVLPPGFRKIRRYGLFAGSRVRRAERLAACRRLLGAVEVAEKAEDDAGAQTEEDAQWAPPPCPHCGAVASQFVPGLSLLPQRAPPVVAPYRGAPSHAA